MSLLAKERYAAMAGKLKKSGLKSTPQRLAVMKLLAESEGHPSVDDICSRLQKKFPGISQATVYRTIQLAKSLGEAYEIAFAGSGTLNANGNGRMYSDATKYVFIAPPQPPTITSHPLGKVVNQGASATFTVGATGATPLSYEWRFEGTHLAGATQSSYTRSNAQASHEGNYDVVVTNVAGTTYTDSGLTNAVTYYYVVVARNGITGLVSGYSNQASGIPQPAIGWANLQWPPTISHTIGILPTPDIYGQVWIDGYTSQPGATPGLLAQVGFGAVDSAPATWTTWVDAAFNVDAGNNDEFKGQLLPETLGAFEYIYRYSTSGGRDWVYADLSGPIADPTQAAPNPGILTVVSSGDLTPPDAPLNLRVTSQSATEVTLAWDASPDSDVYAYDLYRSQDSASQGEKIARLLSPTITYVDTDVVRGETYYYVVRALDTSFNVSADSNQVSATPAPRLVDVTLVVEVPPYTPDGADLYFSRYVNPDGTLGGWDPAATKIEMWYGDYVDTLTILEGTLVEFKFTRGSWDTVEKGPYFEEIADRQLLVEYGFSGISTVYLKVDNWRDPLVAATSPADGAVDVPLDATVVTYWSRPMAETTTFEVKMGDQLVDGAFSFDEYFQTLTFTPTEPLELSSTYTVNVAGQVADSGDLQQVPLSWSFTTIGVPPFVSFSAEEYRVFENAGTALVTIELSEPAASPLSVIFSALPGTASSSDFDPYVFTVTFAKGEQTKQIQVWITDDTRSERIETILLKLSYPTGAILSEPFEAVLYLFDDENRSYCSFIPGLCSNK